MSIHTNWIVKYRSQIPYITGKDQLYDQLHDILMDLIYLTADEFQ